jgi:hypothetical protein
MNEKRVYFIQAKSGGPIKIGVTTDIQDRRKALQSSHPEELVVLAHRPGDEVSEMALHRKLTRYRLKGEWFEDCAEVRVEVAAALEHPQVEPSRAPARAVVGRKGPDHDFMLETFVFALKTEFDSKPNRHREIGHLSGVSSRTAELWLQGKSMPHTANLIQFARNNRAMRAWFMAIGAAQSLAHDMGVSLREGWDELARRPHEAIRFWHGQDQMLIAMGQAP